MKTLKKTLAVILCLFLVDLGGISQDIYAANANLSAGVFPSGNEQKGFTASSFINPILQKYASLEEFTPSTRENGLFIIHIRDLHCHDEAQMKIANTLEELWRGNSTGDLLVLTEGAEGFVDTHIFGSFPDSMSRKEASKSFLDSGKITGPEYLSITKYGELPIRIEGVEDSDLYLESFMTFRNVIGRKQETDAFLKMVDEIVHQIKKKTFSKDLLELDQKEKQYYEGTLPFEAYAHFLEEQNQKSILKGGLHEINPTLKGYFVERQLTRYQNEKRYINFKLLVEVLQRQKAINLEKVEEERNRVIEALSQRLTKEELARLIKGGIEYRIGKVTLKDYFEELEKLSIRYLISSESSIEAEYPNLAAYIELVGLQAKIDHQALFSETSEMTKKVKENSSRTAEEKEVLEFAKKCQILKRILNLEITREDHSFYNARKDAYQVQTIQKELGALSSRYGQVFPRDLSEKADKAIQIFKYAERFYELALKRDRVMVEKALEKLKGKDEKKRVTVVLITGGFHTEGVKRLLRKNNVGYAIMTPRVSGESDMTNYRNLMMDERISTRTISFFSLFNQKLASRFPEMRQQELMELGDDLIQLSAERKVDRALLQAWVEELSSQNTGDPEVRNLMIHFKARLEGEQIELKEERPILSPEIIHKLINDYSLLTAELAVEVLKELGEGDLLKQALNELEKRRATETLKAKESEGFQTRSLAAQEITSDVFSNSNITQKHIGAAAVNIDAMQEEVARVEFRKPSLLEMREADTLRTVVKEWLKQSLDQELGKVGLNTSLIGWDSLSQVLDALSRGLNKVKVRYNNQDYQVEVKLAQSELAVPNVHAMTHRDRNVIQIVISKGHLDALPHELIETLLLTRPENRSPPNDQKRLREHAVHTKVVLLEPLFDPMLEIQDRKIDGKIKGRVLRELKEQMPSSLSKLIAGSVQANRDIEAKQGVKALDAQSTELAKDLARNIVYFATQRLKRLKNDDLHLLGEGHGKTVWIERRIMSRFTDFGFLKEEEFGGYLRALLERELRRLSFKRDEIVIALRSSSFSSPLRQLFEPRTDMKPSVRKQLLRRALKYEISSISFHHERSVLRERAALGQIKDVQGKVLSEQQIGDLPDSEVIFLVQPYLSQVEERFSKEDADFTFQLQSEELIEEAIFNLLKRKDLSGRVGPQNHEEWEKYISEILSPHERDVQLNFLQVLATYLNNDIPEAGLLRSLPIELLFELTRLTVRYDLWNDESIEAFAGYAEEAINRIKLETGKPPVIVELSSGYGDLSFGLSRRFPEIRVIPTDGMSRDPNRMEGQTGFYDPNIIAERGVQTLSVEEILSGEFRKELHIPEDVGVILIVSHLPSEKGVERGLLNQTHAQELLFIHSRRVGMKDRVSGDSDVLPNRDIWDFDFSYLDPEVWFNSLIYRGRRDDLELYALSRKPYQVGIANGAVHIQKTEELLKSEKVSAADFLNWLYSHIGWDLTFENIKTIFEKASLSPEEYQQFLKILDNMVKRSTDSKKKEIFLQSKVYFKKLRPFEFDLDQEIEKLMNLIQAKTEKAFGRRLLVQDEKNIREMIQMVRDVHKNQIRKDGKTPYFAHQLEVTRILVETFGIIDPLAIQIALLHDTREDQEELYSEVRVKLYEDVLKKIRDQDGVNLLRLGVRLLSKLEGEKFANLSPEEAEKEYFRRLVHPKSVYSKDQDPRYQDIPWYSGYDNDFIHHVQLIKLADRIANISDMENLFREVTELSEKIKVFPRKVFDKTLNAFIPMFVLNKESQLAPEERNIFLDAFKNKLDQYIKSESQRLEFLKSAAQDARKRLEQMTAVQTPGETGGSISVVPAPEGAGSESIPTLKGYKKPEGLVKHDARPLINPMMSGPTDRADLAAGKVKEKGMTTGNGVDRPVFLDQLVNEMVSKFLEEKVTLEELEQYVEALKNRRYLDGRVTKAVGISQRLMNKHRLLKGEALDVLLRVQGQMTQIRRETPTIPVPQDKDKEELPPTVRTFKSVKDEKPFDYVSRSVRRFMPLEDVGEKVLPGSVSRLLVTPMLARSEARAKVVDFLRSYIGVRRDWEVAVLDKILMMRNFAHVISSAVSDPTVYQVGFGTGSEKSKDRLNIITPLLETDFKRLIAVEVNTLSFNEFKDRVTNQLKDLVDQGTSIEFPKDEQSEKDRRFVARFTYGQKLRTVVAYFNFDGMEKYPSEIEKGYDVLIKGAGIGEPKFYEKLFELLRDGSGFILAHGNDLTTVEQKEYSDRENTAYLNTVNFGYPLQEFPYFLKNFTEVTSQPFYELARNVSRQERILENGFMESRPVLLAKNNTVKVLKAFQSGMTAQTKESLLAVPSSEVTTRDALSDPIPEGLSENGSPSVTQTLTEESRQKDEVEEVIPIKLGINLFSLKINYPAILKPLSLKDRDLIAESDPHIDLVDKESFVKLIKNLFELKTDLEAEMRSRQFLVKAFQGIVLTTKRTGDYRIINKNGEWSVVEIVNVANAQELYKRLEKILKDRLGREVNIPRMPSSITLYRSESKQNIVTNPEDPEIDMEPTDEEREMIAKAIEVRKPTSFVRTRKVENEGGSISEATSFSGVFKVSGVEANQAASSDQDPSPDGGSIGKWQVTSFEGPQEGHILISLKGIEKNSDHSVENHKIVVTPLAANPALRAYIMNLRFMLSRIKPIGITQITLIKRIQNIIDHFEEMVYSGEVYLMEDNEYLGGYGGKEGIFISRKIFDTSDALIALFHEAGESYYAEKENRWKISKELNPHVLLRGLGKGARERKRELTDTEKALPFWDGKKVGLQDILFGFDRNTLNFGSRGLEGQDEKTPDIRVIDSAISEIEGDRSGWFHLENASNDILWRWRKVNIDDLKILAKAEAVSLGQIGGQSIWVDRQLLKQYEAVGFLKLEDFQQSLKDTLTEQFKLFPPSKETPEIVIALLTDSQDIVENHRGEGFIGINFQLFNHSGLSAKLRKKIFKMSLAHGLIHQHGIGNSEEEESLILQEDMRYAVQLGISTLEFKKSELFNSASTSFLVKNLQQEYARVILDKTHELKTSLEKNLNYSIPFLLQILSNSNSEIETMKVVKASLEKALKDLHEGRNGNGSSSELLRVEQALAPSRTTPLIPRVPTLESFPDYDVARLLRTDHEYGDFYKWTGVLSIETAGMKEKVEWKEALVEPLIEMERMRFEFLKEVLEGALEQVEAHLRGEKIQFPAQTSGIMTRGSKVRKIGGDFSGGSLNPTLFDKEVWIEAGSFAYKLWVEMSSYDDESSKLEKEKHALINLQRHDRKYGIPVDLVYHPLIGQDYSVGHRSDNDYSVADSALGKSHFSVKVTENEFGLFLLEIADNHSELGTTVDWRPPQESVSAHQKPTPFVGPIAEPPIEMIEPEEGDINIADMGLDAPEHGKVNEVIRQAAAEGRLKGPVFIVDGKKVFLVQGLVTLYGKQIAHAGIELSSIYIAEESFNPRLARHEAIELQLWQEKALELAGLDKHTDWESLDLKVRKNLKLKLRGWMRENSAEARKLENEFHETADRLASVPASKKAQISTKSVREEKVQKPFARSKSREDLPVVLQSVRAHVRVFAQDFSNPSELLPKVSQYLEETVLPVLPPTDRPRAIEAAVGELHQVMGGHHHLPGVLGIRESLIPQNLKDKIIDGLTRKGFSEEEVKSLWLQLDDMVGPAWIDLEGKVRGSLTWIRLVVGMMEEAGLLKTKNHVNNVERMSQAMLFHEYVHQVIRPGLSEDDKLQLKTQLGHFLDKFGEHFGSRDIEEVLAQFASAQLTGENADLFEEVALDLESFLSGEVFPVIRLPRDQSLRQKISDDIRSAQPGLLEVYSGDMKLLFIDYRNALIRKAGAERFNDRVKGILDEHMEVSRKDSDLKMEMGNWNLWDLFGEEAGKKSERLEKISDQVQTEVKDQEAKDVNGKVIGMMVKWGSGVLQAWDRIVEKGILEFKGIRKGSRIYVLTIEEEGELTGLKEAYRQMKQTDPQAQMVINTALDSEKVKKWLMVQKMPESLLGKKIHQVDLTKEKTIRSIYNRLGYLVKGSFDIEEDLILIIPDNPEGRFIDFSPYEFKIVSGKIGQKTFLAPDAMGLALVLGSVDWAYRNQQMNPELKDKLKNFFLEVVKEYFENEEEQEEEIKRILVEIEVYGFFRIPTWKNDLNDMMRRFVIQETYIATAA